MFWQQDQMQEGSTAGAGVRNVKIWPLPTYHKEIALLEALMTSQKARIMLCQKMLAQ